MEANRVQAQNFAVRTLSLSIAALLFLVNARAEPLPSVNRGNKASKSSANSKGELDRLIELLIQRGADKKIAQTLAPVIGLEKSADVKQQDNIIKQDDKGVDVRSCFLVFADSHDQKVPMCLLVRRSKQTASTTESRYFKVSLVGKLEKAVEVQGQRTADKGVRGSGVTTNQDIDSAAVQKEFRAEMAYWLKDWLKKESKKVPAKSASAVPAGKTAAAAL